MNIEGLLSPKFIRDPVHDLIRIDTKAVLDVIKTRPMQRLKRIKQLGLANYVYPSADHSRFCHSLGAYHLAIRMLTQLERSSGIDISEEQRLIVQLAALLHDIGHGPFSHLFERVLKEANYAQKKLIKHHNWTIKIINEDPGISKVLSSVGSGVQRDVSSVIETTYEPLYLSSIVSSQFDVDRFDYMLRDSYMTGVHYGEFDLNWMLRNLTLGEISVPDEDTRDSEPMKTVVVDAKRGLSSLENYLTGNFYLYKHVYYHNTVRIAEAMLTKALVRALDVVREGGNPRVSHIFFDKVSRGQELEMDDYLSMDDNVVMSWLQTWASDSRVDEILRSLSVDLLGRDLFKAIPIDGLSSEQLVAFNDQLRALLEENNLNEKYHRIYSTPTRSAYSNYFDLLAKKKRDHEIHYMDVHGKVHKYTGINGPDNAISRALRDLSFTGEIVCVPKVIEKQVKSILLEVSG